MNMFGKTLATTGAAWVCLLGALVVFDYLQDAFNGQSNLLFAGWSMLEIALLALPGLALIVIGTRIAHLY